VRAGATKPVDLPNIKDYLRNRERQRLLEAGDLAGANALSLAASDRVLVVLVEFAGTDVFTWTAGSSTWDPLGIADPNEDTGVIGDCSNIITQTTVFTYSGPAHNEIPRPLSADDRSGDTIWTEDFNPQWFEDFMFGNGVVIDYDREDGSSVYESFIGQSVKDYYLDLSSGTYDITGDVIGWLGLPHSTWWYGADQCPGARSTSDRPANSGAIPGAGSARTLVQDTLDAVNAISDTIPGFDWADYDQDGDGVIDRLWIVHAGYGEEDSTALLNRTDYSEASMWSHSSAVTPPYSVTQEIAAGPYIMMPENGGIGVFAHEYGHNLGADDLYAYYGGETSVGFWSLMSDDWTGYPIGFEPPSMDPWHLDNWGWLDPYVISDTNDSALVTLGQASRFADNTAPDTAYRAVKIELPDGAAELAAPVWDAAHYWYGGNLSLANAMMTTKTPIDLTGVPTATLSFEMVYDIEDEWDFLWVQVSEDGVTWPVTGTLTNANTSCVHAPDWIGSLYGFPDDLCAAGIGGFWGWNAYWPDPNVETFDLSAYAGKQIYLRFWFMTDWATTYTGVFVDNLTVTAASGPIFSSDADTGAGDWDYADPWGVSDGTLPFSHNFYIQWRNVNENGGYDSALGDERWRFGPANSGMLVWYNNNFYADNEIFSYLFDSPSFGPKGRMLVVDAHPEPYRDPDIVSMGYNNEAGNAWHRGQMRDAPFTLTDTVDFTGSSPWVVEGPHTFEGRPPVSAFHDALGYYPGAEYVHRGPAYPATQYRWVTTQWDASATMPATGDYAINAPGYIGTVASPEAELRFDCAPFLSGPNAGYLSCYWLGANTGLGYDGASGHPGADGLQYGWHVQLVEEGEDHTWATVLVWNSEHALDYDFTVSEDVLVTLFEDEADVTFRIDQNAGSSLTNGLVIVPLSTQWMEYVPGSATGGGIPVHMLDVVPFSVDHIAALYAEGGAQALEALAAAAEGTTVAAIAWPLGPVAAGESPGEIGFRFKAIVGESAPIALDAPVDAGVIGPRSPGAVIHPMFILMDQGEYVAAGQARESFSVLGPARYYPSVMQD